MAARTVSALLVLLLAGCAGAAPADPAEGPEQGTAAPAEGGLLRGLVTSDELLPIEGAEIGLENGRGVATTDASGQFEFAGLEPGSILFDVKAIGFEPYTAKADILVDAATDVKVVLRPSPIPVARVESFIFNGYIRAGNAFVDATFLSLGQPGGCDKCLFDVDAKPDLISFQVEPLFSASVAKPHGPLELGWQVWNRTKAELATDVNGMYGGGYVASGAKSVIHHHIPDAYKRWTLSGEGLRLIHYCDATWVCLEQRFQSFASLSYLEPIDPDYSALPDS